MQTTNRKPLVAGNWKMNGDLALIQSFETSFSSKPEVECDVVICPPYPYLIASASIDCQLGAQTLSEFDSGAHTGEVSADMLLEAGCQYVIVGHSERRADNHEADELVAIKVAKVLEKKLMPILCVGESEAIRDAGELFSFIASQIDAVVSQVGIKAFAHIVIAYEPIWAIGTGKTATPEQAQEVHQFIRQHLREKDVQIAENIKILYGGSVKSANASEIFAQPDVDGGLVGGASLQAEEFLRICQAAKQ